MNNRIVNFTIKKVSGENSRGDLYVSLEIGIFAPLGTVGNINYRFNRPPARFNSELILLCWLTITRSIRVTNPPTLFPIEFTRTDLVFDFCETVSSISPRSLSAAHLFLRLFYLMNRVHLSTLDFQTGKRPMVLFLFGFVGTALKFAAPNMPLSMDTKPSIINSDRADSRQYCLARNAGVDPLTAFTPVASKTRDVADETFVRHAIFRFQLRCMSAATVGLLDVLQAH